MSVTIFLGLLIVCCLSTCHGQITNNIHNSLDPSARSILSDLIHRMEKLEQQHEEDREMISKLSRKVADLETRLFKDTQQIAEMTNNLNKLTRDNQLLHEYMDRLKIALPSDQGSVHGPNDRADNSTIQRPTPIGNRLPGLWIDKNHTETRKRTEKRQSSGAPNTSVAFYVVLAHEITKTSQNTIILFEKIVTNIGGQYNQYTGAFTVIQSGVYVFHWTVKTDFNSWVISELVRNGEVLGTNLSEHPNSGSAMAIGELVSGDRVWVRISSEVNGAEIQPIFTTFSGFLLRSN
ncbi:complement C1q tumor necrosis factor-related protein 2-like [Argopecten irradians]|uniref:complement C1q tumor necrosis factor-related protein 2-like n=1 Tax=Argopecten irradians TaxID=31199 RepID=UPI003724337F